MTHNIVVGVDGSVSSFDALAAAADLAGQTGSQLSVVFVHDPGTAGALAGTYDLLIGVAERRSASLIVVGGRGRGHSVVGGLVLGSVAQKLVRSSPISVLVVRHPAVHDHQMAGQPS